jgi:uncharacterized iron-regulated membrane protein
VIEPSKGVRRPWGPRRIVFTLHLCLGRASGLVLFLVGLTGALYVFEPEIKALHAGHRVTPLAERLPASVLAERGRAALRSSRKTPRRRTAAG